MKELILINKETGELGLGIKINFYDNWETNNVCKIEGYTVGFRPSKHDGWLIFTGKNEAEGPWIFCKMELVDEKIESLGEL